MATPEMMPSTAHTHGDAQPSTALLQVAAQPVQPRGDVHFLVALPVAHAVAPAQIERGEHDARPVPDIPEEGQHDVQRPLVHILIKDLGAHMAVKPLRKRRINFMQSFCI